MGSVVEKTAVSEWVVQYRQVTTILHKPRYGRCCWSSIATGRKSACCMGWYWFRAEFAHGTIVQNSVLNLLDSFRPWKSMHWNRFSSNFIEFSCWAWSTLTSWRISSWLCSVGRNRCGYDRLELQYCHEHNSHGPRKPLILYKKHISKSSLQIQR